MTRLEAEEFCRQVGFLPPQPQRPETLTEIIQAFSKSYIEIGAVGLALLILAVFLIGQGVAQNNVLFSLAGLLLLLGATVATYVWPLIVALQTARRVWRNWNNFE